MPFVALASQSVMRAKRLEKKLEANDCDDGVDDAVVEASAAKSRCNSLTPAIKGAVSPA